MLFAFFGTGIPTAIFITEEGGIGLADEGIEAGLTVGAVAAVVYYLYANNWSLVGAAAGGVEGVIDGVICAL